MGIPTFSSNWEPGRQGVLLPVSCFFWASTTSMRTRFFGISEREWMMITFKIDLYLFICYIHIDSTDGDGNQQRFETSWIHQPDGFPVPAIDLAIISSEAGWLANGTLVLTEKQPVNGHSTPPTSFRLEMIGNHSLCWPIPICSSRILLHPAMLRLFREFLHVMRHAWNMGDMVSWCWGLKLQDWGQNKKVMQQWDAINKNSWYATNKCYILLIMLILLQHKLVVSSCHQQVQRINHG